MAGLASAKRRRRTRGAGSGEKEGGRGIDRLRTCAARSEGISKHGAEKGAAVADAELKRLEPLIDQAFVDHERAEKAEHRA